MMRTIKQTFSAAITVAAFTLGSPAIAEITSEQLQAAVDQRDARRHERALRLILFISLRLELVVGVRRHS